MKNKNTLTKLSAIIAPAVTALSQNNAAAASFSQFSMPQNLDTSVNAAGKAV